MNKLKLWKVESLVEGECEPKKSVSGGLIFSAEKEIKKNYKQGVSKFSKDFFLIENFSFEKSLEPVFFGEDREGESEKEKSFFGLKKQQLIFKNKKAIYLVDNHNKALYSFLEILKVLEKKVDIVHIDAHRDDAIFQYEYPKNIDWENIDWCLKKTRVSDYLDLGKKTGLIESIFRVTQSADFEKFKIPKGKYILNLDIDIFGPEGEAVNLKLKIKTIAKAWRGAVAVVVATSPGYISAKDAEEIIKVFVKNF